jgi:hypothetical protein
MPEGGPKLSRVASAFAGFSMLASSLGSCAAPHIPDKPAVPDGPNNYVVEALRYDLEYFIRLILEDFSCSHSTDEEKGDSAIDINCPDKNSYDVTRKDHLGSTVYHLKSETGALLLKVVFGPNGEAVEFYSGRSDWGCLPQTDAEASTIWVCNHSSKPSAVIPADIAKQIAQKILRGFINSGLPETPAKTSD